MELKLNIYNKKEIVKTYTAETYDIMFGTVEDLIDVLDLEGLKTGSDVELIQVATKLIISSKDDIIKPLLKDIFDGLTDDELKNTKVKELASVFINIVRYSIDQITSGNNGKN